MSATAPFASSRSASSRSAFAYVVDYETYGVCRARPDDIEAGRAAYLEAVSSSGVAPARLRLAAMARARHSAESHPDPAAREVIQRAELLAERAITARWADQDADSGVVYCLIA